MNGLRVRVLLGASLQEQETPSVFRPYEYLKCEIDGHYNATCLNSLAWGKHYRENGMEKLRKDSLV